MSKEELITKVKELLNAPSCCSEVSVAAQAYLDAAVTAKEKEAAAALQKALEENVNLIDDTLTFFKSDAAKEAFGEEFAVQKADEAQRAKDAGAKYCVCPACAAGGCILDSKALVCDEDVVDKVPAEDAQAAEEAAPAEEAKAAEEAAPVETMDDYAEELEASFRRINEGDVLRIDTRTGSYIERA